MHTAEYILAIVLTSLLSLFFIILIAIGIGVLKVVSAVKRVMVKAEDVVDSVESATDVIRDASGPLAFAKVVRNIMKANKKRR